VRRGRFILLTSVSTSLLALAATVAAAPTVAPPALVTYRGIHPVSPHMGGFCYINAVHVHRVAPADMRVYVVLPGPENLFVGDPVALGYEGPKFGYFGLHPLAVPGGSPRAAGSGSPLVAPIYCYLKAAHYHADPPPVSRHFVEKDGVFWYMGPVSPQLERQRFRAWVNEAAPIAGYHAPVADLSAAPAGYQPLVLAEAPPRANVAAVGAGAPGSVDRRPTNPAGDPSRRARRPR
jgi:hypothetical protein